MLESDIIDVLGTNIINYLAKIIKIEFSSQFIVKAVNLAGVIDSKEQLEVFKIAVLKLDNISIHRSKKVRETI